MDTDTHSRFGLKEGEQRRLIALAVSVAVIAVASLALFSFAARDYRLSRRTGRLPSLAVYLGRPLHEAERLVGSYHERESVSPTPVDRAAGIARQVAFSLPDLDRGREDGTVLRPSSVLVLSLDKTAKVIGTTLVLTSSARRPPKTDDPQKILRSVGVDGGVDIVASVTNKDDIPMAIGYARAEERWLDFTITHAGRWEIGLSLPGSDVDEPAARKRAVERRRAQLIEEFARLNARLADTGGGRLPVPERLKRAAAREHPVPVTDKPIPFQDAPPLPPARFGSHAGEEMYLVVVATGKTRTQAKKALSELIAHIGPAENTFSVERSSHFKGLEPGYWLVTEGCGDLGLAHEEADRARVGRFRPYVHDSVWKTCDDPIAIIGP